MKQFNYGKFLILILLITPLGILFYYRPDLYQDLSFLNLTYSTIPKVLGISGITLFAINLILSNKFRFIDRIFGGLDKSYLIHKRLGKIVFLLLLLHVSAVGLRMLHISFDAFLDFELDTSDNYITLGRIAFTGLSLIIILTIYYRKSYELLKKIHRFLPLFLFLGVIHSFGVPESDIQAFPILRFYIFGLVGIAIFMFLLRIFASKYRLIGTNYIITEINKLHGEVNEIVMKPMGEKIVSYKPGQFSFYRFQKEGWRHKGEEHPFSFTSIPNDEGVIRVSAKNSGDFTSRLGELEIGDPVWVNGGFGSFTIDTAQNSNLVMIAGGIGITPFISILRDLKAKSSNKYSIDFYYTYNGEENDTYIEVLKELSQDGLIHQLTIVDTEKKERLTAQEILTHTKAPLETDFYICGPKAMIAQFDKDLKKAKVKKQNIHYELFSLFF